MSNCVWKMVANNDSEKRSNNQTNLTLDTTKPCYRCDGNMGSCMYTPSMYTPYSKEDQEIKSRIAQIKEQI